MEKNSRDGLTREGDQGTLSPLIFCYKHSPSKWKTHAIFLQGQILAAPKAAHGCGPFIWLRLEAKEAEVYVLRFEPAVPRDLRCLAGATLIKRSHQLSARLAVCHSC